MTVPGWGLAAAARVEMGRAHTRCVPPNHLQDSSEKSCIRCIRTRTGHKNAAALASHSIIEYYEHATPTSSATVEPQTVLERGCPWEEIEGCGRPSPPVGVFRESRSSISGGFPRPDRQSGREGVQGSPPLLEMSTRGHDIGSRA